MNNLMRGRLGTYQGPETDKNTSFSGIDRQRARLNHLGGVGQQARLITDKRRSLERSLHSSYQGADTIKMNGEFARALINPNKLKLDYDDKIISAKFDSGYKPGDVFEWVGTNTHWLIYLQDLEELAYFRGDIRRCRYQIKFGDESVYAAIRGPVETKIDYIQKHGISVDNPNYSLNILMPSTKEALEYFQRYSKFYLTGLAEGDKQICWRVEAEDAISTPGILEITAVEYYINKDEDKPDLGLVGSLIAEPENPNDEETEETIVGETFIKPNEVYIYEFNGGLYTDWIIDTKKYPVEYSINPNNDRQIKLVWTSPYSGQFTIGYGDYEKTIVVESLF